MKRQVFDKAIASIGLRETIGVYGGVCREVTTIEALLILIRVQWPYFSLDIQRGHLNYDKYSTWMAIHWSSCILCSSFLK